MIMLRVIIPTGAAEIHSFYFKMITNKRKHEPEEN